MHLLFFIVSLFIVPQQAGLRKTRLSLSELRNRSGSLRLDGDELDLEDEGAERLDVLAGTANAIGEFLRNVEFVFVAHGHELQTLGEATNDTRNREFGRRIAMTLAVVEYGSVGESSDVVDGNDVVVRRFGTALALLDDFVLETRRGDLDRSLFCVLLEEVFAIKFVLGVVLQSVLLLDALLDGLDDLLSSVSVDECLLAFDFSLHGSDEGVAVERHDCVLLHVLERATELEGLEVDLEEAVRHVGSGFDTLHEGFVFGTGSLTVKDVFENALSVVNTKGVGERVFVRVERRNGGRASCHDESERRGRNGEKNLFHCVDNRCDFI